MFSKRSFAIGFALCVAAIGATSAQIIEAAEGAHSVLELKDAIDFYRDFVVAPTKIAELHDEVVQLYAGDGNRYEGISTALAVKMGWISNDPEQLRNMKLLAVPSMSSSFGYFDIRLGGLTAQQCTDLVTNLAVDSMFVRVLLNGQIVARRGHLTNNDAGCRSQWFWQTGKNVIDYISA